MQKVTGPTGAGKSTFIEALAGDSSLNISKDQLESCTQGIQSYQAVDVQFTVESDLELDVDIYILDTPGFSDTQKSELEIVDMINHWMKSRKCQYIDLIFYFSPITDIRLSGSKRRTVEMLKLLGKISGEEPSAMYVVTTMWDRIWTERAREAAEVRYTQLRDEVWKDLSKHKASLIKFLNTHESALDVISNILRLGDQVADYSVNFGYDATEPLPKSLYSHLYYELVDRIINTQQQKRSVEVDLATPETQANRELKLDVKQRLQQTNRILAKFEKQLIGFGDPPEGFEHVAQLRKNILRRLMGPTGAGKSSFIEALAGDNSLNISKDQLESCTQGIQAYRLVNIKYVLLRDKGFSGKICIVDTPGFSDTQKSELEIVDMINDWMKSRNHLYHELVDRIINTRQQKKSLEDDLGAPETQSNEELKLDVTQRLQQTNRILAKFEKQLIGFGDPPEGFEHVAQFRKDILRRYPMLVVKGIIEKPFQFLGLGAKFHQ
ncbi:hypothetical protein CVT24_007630 [Panaeolus cyanescens]|uniref:G domain-containing protein n=1 Tax=Panaeolus cyanescens TaxID=181874 RepID=A0A409W552_9AGAR|nr:hypothetical protein CVT24_007630 [Panaeolus cyanescens]